MKGAFMAFIYRYEIEDRTLRNRIDLRDERGEIERIIEDFFSLGDRKLLKSIRVYRDYFEYSLHLAANIKTLTDVNMRVELVLKNLYRQEGLVLRKKNISYLGFIQEEYMGRDYGEISSIELIPLDQAGIKSWKDIGGLDVFTLRFKERDIGYYSIDEGLEGRVGDRFLILEGNYGNKSAYPKITGFLDADYLENYSVGDREIYGQDNYTVRNFNIKAIRRLSDQEREVLASFMKVLEDLDQSIEKVDPNYFKGKYEEEVIGGLQVYDIGQGLMQSVFDQEGAGLIYFDIGIDKNTDILNYRKKDQIQRDRTVILSHIHLDHWHMLNVDIDAYYQDYLLPRQEKGVLFSKRLAEIRTRGRQVYYVEEDLDLGFGRLYRGRKARKGKEPDHKHEDGLYSLLRLGGRKLLLAGDHSYEFMEDLGGLDVLVASHHGGEFAQEGREREEDLPRPRSEDAILIYSYGETNPYGHPNRQEEYRKVGWLKEHHTAKEGDFIWELGQEKRG